MSEIPRMHIGLHVKYLLVVWRIKRKLNSLDRFSKNTEKQNFIDIRPMVAELFRADKRTGEQK